MSRMIFHVGTTNPGKLAEIAALLAPLAVELKPIALDVPETGTTFEENARLKALAYAAHAGGKTIAEDSGIVVPALDRYGYGRLPELPGPWSARFDDLDLLTGQIRESGRERITMDLANNERVLALMRSIEQPHRLAIFKVVLVVAAAGKILFEAKAHCRGWIADEARGENGFGYDPIFVGQDTYGRTFAELDSARKNLRSHRKRVLDELYGWVSQEVRVTELVREEMTGGAR